MVFKRRVKMVVNFTNVLFSLSVGVVIADLLYILLWI